MIGRYYHTIKSLKWIQLYKQLTFRLTRPRARPVSTPATRSRLAPWKPAIPKHAILIANDQICCLNETKTLTPTIWTNPNIDKLWLYHLHYFEVLQTEGAIQPAQIALIERWIIENPPVHGCGWEPYPLSLRIVNWVKWCARGGVPTPAMLNSLATQTGYLLKRLEKHLLGNHLLANAKALIFSGLFFKDSKADRWFNKGIMLFNKELSLQILKDGGHIERSPMYHSLILEDLLDVINLFQMYGREFPKTWIDCSHRMMRWLKIMSHPDGDIAFFNDATLKIAPRWQALADYQASILGPIDNDDAHNNIHSHTDIMALEESGYFRLQNPTMTVLIDAAPLGPPYQPGHGHADTLSFELSIGKQRLIVNSGISSYTETPERLRQRGSAAHNTLVIDQQNSSDVWKSFRVGKRARITNSAWHHTSNILTVQAMHNGYAHLGQCYHHRTWCLRDKQLLITDAVKGQGLHLIEIYFHLHPAFKAEKINDRIIGLFDQQHQQNAVIMTIYPITLQASTYHPAFNCSLPNQTIVIAVKQTLPFFLNTAIVCH